MSIGIEELTHQELVSWIRENVADINEEDIVLETLRQREQFALDMCQEVSQRGAEKSRELLDLIDGCEEVTIRPGVKGRKLPGPVWAEYQRRRAENKDAGEEWNYWFHKYKVTNQKIRDIERIRLLRIGDKIYEQMYERRT